jgi:hypothetical protein
MEDNTVGEITGQVNIADVLKIIDTGIKEADVEEKDAAGDDDYETAIEMQHEANTLRWVREAILKLERKP